jgi:glycosyltransferase involved in cell wall biosynthesis
MNRQFESSKRTVLIVGGLQESLVSFRGELIKAIVKKGYRVVTCAADEDPLIYTSRVNDSSTEIANTIREIGAEFYSVPLARNGLNPFQDLQTLFALYRLMKSIRPDIVLAYTLKPVLYSSFAAKFAKVPEVYSMITGAGSMLSEDSKVSLIQKMIRVMLRLASSINKHVFFQNPDDRNMFLRTNLLGKKTTSSIINGSGVDLDFFYPVPASTNPITFLLIARLLIEKGIYEYIEAARLIRSKCNEIRFLLVGRIVTSRIAIKEDELRKWCTEGIIEYHGVVDDVRPIIAESSVFVLPSYYEGTPRTVLEAMAMGRPIVTTHVPGCRETVIDGENGFLVPAKDPNALANAMMQFITSPELILRMGKRSRQIAEEKYDVHKVNTVIMNTIGLC